MDNLFTVAKPKSSRPLADTSRPITLDDVIGQSHLLGEGKPLRRRVSEGRIGSVVLYGPPGTGKTTIAQGIGNTLKKRFEYHHGAGFKVDTLKKIVEEAQVRETLVFIDEIHRLSATQQDHLLDHTEKGVFDLITATSVNPYHNLSDALGSRSAVYELRPLTRPELVLVLERGVAQLAAIGKVVTMEENAKQAIARKSGGDARRALTTLESIILGRGNKIDVTLEMVEEELGCAPFRYDRGGDMHYDATSAFVKSMRGGDADATLYWLGFLLSAGEDPRYIARRMVVHASEDVGLADNSALQTAVACFTAVENIGMPEGRIVLAHAALHICRAPKSNSAYRGINLALAHLKDNGVMPVPNHLRDTHYVGAAPLGRGGYRSPHSSPDGWLQQDYAPGIALGQFYQSDARSAQTFEGRSDGYWEKVMKKLIPRKWSGSN